LKKFKGIGTTKNNHQGEKPTETNWAHDKEETNTHYYIRDLTSTLELKDKKTVLKFVDNTKHFQVNKSNKCLN
jgi:hypothetical protein